MLSDAKIRAAKPREKAFKLTDSHRLYLQVMPSGSKLWRWSYAFDGKQKTMPLGDYPRVSLLNARSKRDEAKGQLENGQDPLLATKLRVEGHLEAGRQTFERVARAWYDNVKSQWASVHADDVLRSLERDVFPKIGDIPISQLTPPKVLEVLKPLFKGRQPAITDLPAPRKMINDAEGDFARPTTRLALRLLALTAVPVTATNR